MEDSKGRAVLLVGAGGLGTPVLLRLAPITERLGFTLTVVERDTVDKSNLNRQFLYTLDDVGRSKAEAVRVRASGMGLKLHVVEGSVSDTGSWESYFARFSLVLDCTDSVEAKYEINSLCVKTGVPLVHAAVQGWEGQVLAVLPGRSACYRCVFREIPGEDDVVPPPRAGIMGMMSGFVGAMQAERALGLLKSEPNEEHSDRLTVYDMRRQRVRDVPVRRWDECPVCGGLEA